MTNNTLQGLGGALIPIRERLHLMHRYANALDKLQDIEIKLEELGD